MAYSGSALIFPCHFTPHHTPPQSPVFSNPHQQQFYELVEKAKGRGADKPKIELATAEEKEKQKRLGGVVAEFRGAKYMMGERVLLEEFTYNFRQRDRIAIVGNNGVGKR